MRIKDPNLNWHNPTLLVATRHNHDVKSVQSGKSIIAALSNIISRVTKSEETIGQQVFAIQSVIKSMTSSGKGAPSLHPAAVRERVAAAHTRAREPVKERERTVRELEGAMQSQPQVPAQQHLTDSSPQQQVELGPERRTSRRLAGADPETDVALMAATVSTADRREHPKTIEEAKQREEWLIWKEAVEGKLDALKETGTYKVVDLPPGANFLTGKWVLTIKHNTNGSVNSYKGRWVARGYSQSEGNDYDETHAPTARMASVRMLGALAAADDLELIQWDYTTAYLNGELHNTVYIRPPEGYDAPEGKVWFLVKALYGLKQAGREWNTVLVQQLVDMGFKQSRTDASLFVKTEP
ncbi:hypothetical protein CF319_g7444 [Tilletia indica]|nr:hypothetical protein CF319_g7444 [Tilletia indica]